MHQPEVYLPEIGKDRMNRRVADLKLKIAFAQSSAEACYARSADLKELAKISEDLGMEEYARENSLRDELEALVKGKTV